MLFPEAEARAFPRAIFFDAMGTLFSLREPVGETYARIGAAHGLVADAAGLEAAFRAAWRRLKPPEHPEGLAAPDDDRSWWQELAGAAFCMALNVPEAPGAFLPAFEALYRHYATARAWVLHEDTVSALMEMRRHSRLFVLSNFDGRLRLILRGLGIDSFFERVIVSSEVGAGKPHARMFRAALDACGVHPARCLHVGDDRDADLAGANAAGIPCFLLDRPRLTLATLVKKLAAGNFPACIGGIGG